MVWTLSNSCSVAEIARMGERFDSTASHHREDTTALRPHERWDENDAALRVKAEHVSRGD